MTNAPETVMARVFGVDESALRDDTTPETLPQWDSLAHMLLIVELEREFSVAVAPVDAMELRSVSAVKDYLRTHGVSW